MKDLRIAAAVSTLTLVLFPLSVFASTSRAGETDTVIATQAGGRFGIENHSIRATVSIVDGSLRGLIVADRAHATELRFAEPFAILLKDGTILDTNSLKLLRPPERRVLTPRPDASRLADRLHGERFDFYFENNDHSVRVSWSLILLDGSHYLRQVLTIEAPAHDASISRVQLIDVRLAGAHVEGSVNGSPIVAGNFFLGFEHPLSQSRVTGNRATAWMDRELPLLAGQSVTYSSVIGAARSGQMRRDFLSYLERERAHPYRTFLHYNSWYDLGLFTPYNESDALDRVNAFGSELTQKRGVKLDSFLFDDGWDDHKSLWKFNEGFSNGFTSVRETAEKYGADPGVWMSPWGGYSKPKEERIDFGRANGYEIVANGYALSGPRYYAAFRDVCLQMVQKYGVNQFKFDGTGNVNSVVPGSDFDSDFSAAIHLIGELRAAKPDVFINLTTGTWPSPSGPCMPTPSGAAATMTRRQASDRTASVGSHIVTPTRIKESCRWGLSIR